MLRITKFLICCLLLLTSAANASDLTDGSLLELKNRLNSNIYRSKVISPEIQHLKEHYEFKGILSLSDEYSFSILDTKTRQSQWLNLGDRFNGIQLVEFNPELQQLIVLVEDKTLKLDLTDPEVSTVAFSTQSNESANHPVSYSKSLQKNSTYQNHRATRREILTTRSSGQAVNVSKVQATPNNSDYFNGISNSANKSSDTIGEENSTLELESDNSIRRPQIVKRPRPLRDIYLQ